MRKCNQAIRKTWDLRETWSVGRRQRLEATFVECCAIDELSMNYGSIIIHRWIIDITFDDRDAHEINGQLHRLKSPMHSDHCTRQIQSFLWVSSISWMVLNILMVDSIIASDIHYFHDFPSILTEYFMTNDPIYSVHHFNELLWIFMNIYWLFHDKCSDSFYSLF